MSNSSVQDRLEIHLEHARAVRMLDDELGTRHGVGWMDYVILSALPPTGQIQSVSVLAKHLGLKASRLVLLLQPLEKIGLLKRFPGNASTQARVELSLAGARLLQKARECAEELCARVKCS